MNNRTCRLCPIRRLSSLPLHFKYVAHEQLSLRNPKVKSCEKHSLIILKEN